MAEKVILALDLGTTGNRAIAFDRGLGVRSSFYEEFPQVYPKPGWVEHDALAIWQSVRDILKKTFQKISVRDVAAIGVTNQRETVLLWDKKTGKPLHRAIVWQDRRTAPFCAQLRKKGLSKKIHRATGLVIDPYFSATKLRWLLQHVKPARVLEKEGRLLAGTIDTWIIWKLSGGRAHVTDSSNASRTMLFNIHTKSWDPLLCKLFGVPIEILPEVVPSSARSATLDKALFGVSVPIAGIVGDQQGAAFAQGCFKGGVVKNTYGTGLFAVESTGPKPRFSKNLLTTVAWSLGDLKKTDYAVEGSVFIGGAAVQWLRDGIRIIGNARETTALALSVPSNEGVYFVPALVGLGAPYWDAHARGTIVGITRGTTRAHFVRAALESIAYQTRDILEVMKKDTRHPLKVLRVDGGASANDFLMQFQADILGIPVERPRILETTALGAAALAGLAVGFWKDQEDFGRHRRVDKIFKPRMDRKTADKLFSKWKDAVERSRNWSE
jgi:glycerol kinase